MRIMPPEYTEVGGGGGGRAPRLDQPLCCDGIELDPLTCGGVYSDKDNVKKL